jgi:hypothetical protein
LAYRNDHDAALARFDAELERERQAARAGEPAPVERVAADISHDAPVSEAEATPGLIMWLVPAAAMLGGAVIFAIGIVVGLNVDSAPPPAPRPIERTMFTECVRNLPEQLPRDQVQRSNLAGMRRTILACRDALQMMAAELYASEPERDVLLVWVQREAELARALSRVPVGNVEDPAAQERWRELERAFQARNEVAIVWRERFSDPPR